MSVSEQLWQAVEDSGLSLYAIAKGAGLHYPTVYRFYHRQRDIYLETADQLAEFFGMRLTRAKKIPVPPDGRRRPAKGGKK